MVAEQDLIRSGQRRQRARKKANEANAETRELVLAALAEGWEEAAAARLAQVDRMTVRKWQGKR